MPLSWRPDPDHFWAHAPTTLRICAEAGFIAVLYAALTVLLEGIVPLLGPIEFVLLVALGAVVGHIGRERPELGAPALILAVIGGGACGWLASPSARDLLQADLGAALARHGIGWIGAFAVLRGSLIRGGESGAFQLERLLRSRLPIVALVWALATIYVARPLWPSFVAYALAGTLLLIVTGLAGMGLMRLRILHAGVQETHVRRLWRWLVIAAAVTVVPLAVPFAVLSGVPVDVLLQPLIGPGLFLLGLIVVPLGLLASVLLLILTPLAALVAQALDGLRALVPTGGRPQSDPVEADFLTEVLAIAFAAVVVVILAIAIYRLARWVLSRQDGGKVPPHEVAGIVEHAIVVPSAEHPQPRTGARHRRGAARDAVGAYVRAVDILAAHPDWARGESETPAEHSLRVRQDEMPGATDFARLAADYQLARYAEVTITPREDRRALSRLDKLRRALARH